MTADASLADGPGRCLLCGELVTWPEAGYYPTAQPIHPECGTRSALGGIGHLTNHAYWCTQQGDPDAGLSYRESARQVLTWMEQQEWAG